MQLKQSQSKFFKRRFLIAGGMVLGLLMLIGAVFLGALLQRRYGGLEPAAEYIRCNKAQQLEHLSEGRISLLRGIPRIQLDLSQDAYGQLSEKRKEALSRGALIKGEDDFVSAELSLGGQQLPAKIRLKGDLLDHLRGDKWSFRIELKGEGSLMGMKRFSVHRPETRNHIWEWIALQMMQQEGLIALRYHFIELTLNGENLGIYAMEEHFEKRLIENNQRREGPILKFDMTQWQQERLGYEGHALPGSGEYYSNPIDVFEGRRMMADSALTEQFEAAHARLQGFRLGKLKASEVFEVEAFATFIALCDLLGGQHALNTHQFRFYYNPLTTKLEPVPYDHNAGHRLDRLAGTLSDADYYRWEAGFQTLFLDGLFRDRDFYAAYVRALGKVSEEAFLQDFWSKNDSLLRQNLQWIQHEYPCFIFDKSIIAANQVYIRKMLNPPLALFAHQKDGERLEFANRQGMPIEVVGIYRNDSLLRAFQEGIFLGPKHPKFPPTFKTQKEARSTLTKDSLQIGYRLPGAANIAFAPLQPWPFWDQSASQHAAFLQEPNLASFAQLKIDHEGKSVMIPEGTLVLDNALILPPGYQLIANAGTFISLKNGAFILVQGPVSFLGNGEDPITISADAASGGLFVNQADSLSRFEYVLFHHLKPPQMKGWQPSGAVSCYESDADFRHCSWMNCEAEDALHAMRGEYALTDCEFHLSASDALDADFCRLHLNNLRFTQSKNDAIDLSGSMAFMRNIHINQAGDKGISAGEESRVEAWDISIEEAQIGIASKDLSDVWVDGISMQQNRLDLALFQKKAEFGPAKMRILHWQGGEVKDSVANNSVLVIE
jgi:hypothetical protein